MRVSLRMKIPVSNFGIYDDLKTESKVPRFGLETMKLILLSTIAAVVLVGCGNAEADRALLDAAENGNIEAARQAIADGADVDTLDKRGRAPIQNALHSNNIEAVKLLIDNGANLNTKAPNSWTPLYEAVLMGHMETVKLLIENGANVNAKDQMGGTPLDQVQNEEIIDYLRLYGGKTGAELKAEGK